MSDDFYGVVKIPHKPLINERFVVARRSCESYRSSLYRILRSKFA